MTAFPRVVCFDLGNVLVRICGSWAEGCRAAGVSRAADLDAVLAADDRFAELQAAYQRGDLPFGRFTQALASLAAERGVIIEPALIAQVHRSWILGEVSGAPELLRELVRAEALVAVLSNTCGEHWPQLEAMSFMQFVHVPVGSHMIGAVKPDDAAYAAIEARTDARGDQILFFDDLQANVEAAAERGWRAVRVEPGVSAIREIRAALREHGLGER